jgi:hypothetical protein
MTAADLLLIAAVLADLVLPIPKFFGAFFGVAGVALVGAAVGGCITHAIDDAY